MDQYKSLIFVEAGIVFINFKYFCFTTWWKDRLVRVGVGVGVGWSIKFEFIIFKKLAISLIAQIM